MVGKWAYIKELAAMNTRGRGEWSLLGYTQKGNVAKNGEERVSIGEKIREKYDWCSSFLTVSLFTSKLGSGLILVHLKFL